MKSENFKTIRKCADPILADLIVAALHNAGIQVFRLDETHTNLPGDNVEIIVAGEDADRALEIIENQVLG